MRRLLASVREPPNEPSRITRTTKSMVLWSNQIADRGRSKTSDRRGQVALQADEGYEVVWDRVGSTIRLAARLLRHQASRAHVFPNATDVGPIPLWGSNHARLPRAPWRPVCVQARCVDALRRVPPRDELFDVTHLLHLAS